MDSISELKYNILKWTELKEHYEKQLETEFAKTQPQSINIKETVQGGLQYQNKIETYVINTEVIQAKIDNLTMLISDGIVRLEKIKNALRGLKHPKYKAYYMRKELYIPMWKIAEELDRTEGTIRKWLRDMKEEL